MTTTDLPQACLLSEIPLQDLHWLWPHYLPKGHLTLLEGPYGIGTSLFALHLAACLSSGQPLPDGTPCSKGGVVLLSPHCQPSLTLLPRIQAAGGDPTNIVLLDTTPLPRLDPEASPAQHHPFNLLQDYPLLESFIAFNHASLVILDPITTLLATASLAQRLDILAYLADLAYRTDCAILLLRPITVTKTLLANPTHLSASAIRDPLLSAVPARLLLLPDPTDNEQLLLHCPKHCLGPQPPTLAANIVTNPKDIPSLLWLGEVQDPIAQQDAAFYSQQRQLILSLLNKSETALDALTVSEYSVQSYQAVRKMLQRMLHDGQLASPARGLYTIPNHPCLTQPPSMLRPDMPHPDMPCTGVIHHAPDPSSNIGETCLHPDMPRPDMPCTGVIHHAPDPSSNIGETCLHPDMPRPDMLCTGMLCTGVIHHAPVPPPESPVPYVSTVPPYPTSPPPESLAPNVASIPLTPLPPFNPTPISTVGPFPPITVPPPYPTPVPNPSIAPTIPGQPSETPIPNVASVTATPTQPTNPYPVPNVATVPTPPPQPELDASDLYPSAMIRPRQEDYEWILRQPYE